MPQNDESAVFMQLGLTFLQSKIYLTLVDIDEATIKTIAKASNVARQEIYRITAELENKGLLEKIISVPIKYRAIPPNEGLSILLQRRDRETQKIRKDANRLIRQYEDRTAERTTQEKTPQFILIPEKEAFLNKLRTAMESTTESLHQVTTEKRFLQATKYFLGTYVKALNRGVAIQVIVEKNNNEKALQETVQSLLKEGDFMLRRLPSSPKASVAIFDKRNAFVTLYPTTGLRESPAILTDNPSFLSIYQDYFENIWKNGEKYDCHRDYIRMRQ